MMERRVRAAGLTVLAAAAAGAEVVHVDAVRAWIDSIKPPPDLIVMEEADHFFHRRLMDLRGLLKNGVRDQLPDPIPGPPSS